MTGIHPIVKKYEFSSAKESPSFVLKTVQNSTLLMVIAVNDKVFMKLT